MVGVGGVGVGVGVMVSVAVEVIVGTCVDVAVEVAGMVVLVEVGVAPSIAMFAGVVDPNTLTPPAATSVWRGAVTLKVREAAPPLIALNRIVAIRKLPLGLAPSVAAP